MSPQEAYQQGVKASEETLMNVFENILRDEDDGIPFPNSRMEAIRQVVKLRSDYYHGLAKRNNNIGKSFRKKIQNEIESIDKSKQ